MNTFSFRQRAFIMIELLVVIAIIARVWMRWDKACATVTLAESIR